MNRRDFLLSTAGLLLPAVSSQCQEAVKSSSPASDDIVFADFENGTYAGWTLSGNCWGETPASETTYGAQIKGFEGKHFLCSFHPRLGGAATGKAISPEFTIEKPFLTFLIGGGNLPDETCMNLIVEGKTARTATGNNLRTMQREAWQVRSLLGKRAHLEVVDTSTASSLSYIMVDDIRFAMSGKTSVYDEVDFNAQFAQKTMNLEFQQAMQQTVQEIVTKNQVVGATVACVVDGKLAAAVAVGERKIGSGIPIEVTNPMHIGSNTKGMTALVFARLVEQGKLRFDETVQQAFSYNISPEYRSLPLIEFLYQRSGFTQESVPDIFDRRYFPRDPQGLQGTFKEHSQIRQQFAKDCLNGKPGYPPRSKHFYRNENFICAGVAEELASGTPWEELMQEEVFKPLHMKAAGFGPMGTGKDVNFSWQHIKENGQWKSIYHDNPSYLGPAGTIHCSALDLANYAYARVLGSYGKASYLSPSTWRIVQNPPQGSSYACGIATSSPGPHGIRDMSHGGSNNMSCSDWWVRHEGRLIVVAMINCMSPEANKELLDALQMVSEQWFHLK